MRNVLVLVAASCVVAYTGAALIVVVGQHRTDRVGEAVVIAIAGGLAAWLAAAALRELASPPRPPSPAERLPTQRWAAGVLLALGLTVLAGAIVDPRPGALSRALDLLLWLEIAAIPVVLIGHLALRWTRR